MHDESYKIRYQETISCEEEAVLINGLAFEAHQKRGLGPAKSFAFFIRGPKQEILGGVKGFTYYGCLYIDSLWICSTLRNKGYGSALIHDAEKLGKDRGCSFVTVTTMDWEALPFYQKYGYEIEYTRDGYENNSKMHILRKFLK